MLRLAECSAAYGPLRVLDRISLELAPGETAALIGPSGCGKSTLLAMMAGLKDPLEGSVSLDGRPILPGDERVGLILQHYGLFPWMTVEENVELGLRLRRVEQRRRDAVVREHLRRVGLDGLESRYPAQLSGGQKQRVAIARTLALEPRLLLMDEPFSALDELTREGLQDLLLELLNERRVIAVIVTHSIEEAVYLGEVVLLLSPAPATRLAARLPGCRPVGLPKERAGAGRADREYFEACRRVRSSLERASGRYPGAGAAHERE